MLRGSQTNQVRTELGKIDKNWLLFLSLFRAIDEKRLFHFNVRTAESPTWLKTFQPLALTNFALLAWREPAF